MRDRTDGDASRIRAFVTGGAKQSSEDRLPEKDRLPESI